jgi:hypothetical protein
MRMFVWRSVVVSSVCVVLSGLGLAQETLVPEPNVPEPNAPSYKIPVYPSPKLIEIPPEKLFSPSVSELFYEIAYELIRREDITDSQAEQAIMFLNAAMELDVSTGFAMADVLTILSRPGSARHLQLLYDSLVKYAGRDSDCLIAANAVRCLLEQLDSRDQREVLLSRLIRDVGEYNLTLESELATALGLLFAEKADNTSAARTFAVAYTWNRYNQLAYEKLVELVPNQLGPVSNLEYLRLKVRKNPLDIDAATAFAQYAQKVGLYDIAVGSYQYCTDLFGFLFPGQDVPIAIYNGWMTSCYNTPRGQPRCLQLAEQLRKQGRFDLQIEVLAAMSAAKTGDADTAASILKTAEQKALRLIADANKPTDYKSIAWFYCFVRQDPNKALDWANKAYSTEPNSPVAAGLLACALADNNEPNIAKPLLENYPQTQFAAFAQAKFNLAAGQKQAAIDSLRSAIDKAPGSIVAEQALRLLSEQQADYIPIFDTNLIVASLKRTVGEQLVPQFVSPDRILSFQLNVRGNRFSYGNKINGAVSITNNWYEPLVISENGMCTGRISIDADVTGDLQARFERLVSTTTRPARPIEPGQSTLVPVRLCTGPLRKLLISHPQASLKIRFTAYLDPVITGQGHTASAIPAISPAIIEIDRPRVEITTDYLQNRFESLSKGKQGPKIKAAQLFAGLMMEARELDAPQPGYKRASMDWMDSMLKSALAFGLTDSDWVVKVHTLAAIEPLPLDYELTNAAASALNDPHWPARMMAVWLLIQKQPDSFAKVLDHTAQYDPSEFVRGMALVFGAKVPEPNQPIEQPFLNLFQREPNAEASGS